ncbi:MAG: EAL domain-containing protein, partial [Rhodospirillales bacterium]|nr:EAL domain-containing protein [Rhodospirillales bacterium]
TRLAGMAALRAGGEPHWNLHGAATAAVVAVGLAVIAMELHHRLDDLAGRLAAVATLALAAIGLDVAIMAGIGIVPGAAAAPVALLSGQKLALAVAGAIAPVLMLGLTSAALDQESARRSAVELQRLQRFADATFEGILLLRDGIVADANAAFCRLIAEPAARLVGKRIGSVLPALAGLAAPWTREAAETELRDAEGRTRAVEVLVRPLEAGGGRLAVAAVRDVAERKEAERRIAFLAHHDTLTGLPNRGLFNDRLAQALAMAERSGDRVALLFLDLDGFKSVNDTHGHPAGDRLLCAVADRLATELREMDTLARLGGDEFAIVQPLGAEAAGAAALARRLVDMLSMSFDLGTERVSIGVSIGIAMFPDDARAGEMLMRRADLALLRAKRDGRGMYCFFEPEMDRRQQYRRLLERDLGTALERGELTLHYQPLCRTDTGEVIRREALLRWNHPTRGAIPPADFIPLAEETGLILPLGRFVLERACAEAARWPAPRAVAVNLSPAQFGQRDLVEMVAGILRRTGLAPGELEIEVTEGILIRNAARASSVLRGLKALGVGVTLDDFGTGYSSLAYLRRFPFDGIKIDRSFVQGLGADPESATIVRSILALCRSLGLRATAEGVETEAQLAILAEYGCEAVQGYLFGRPAPMPREISASPL